MRFLEVGHDISLDLSLWSSSFTGASELLHELCVLCRGRCQTEDLEGSLDITAMVHGESETLDDPLNRPPIDGRRPAAQVIYKEIKCEMKRRK